MVLIRSLAQAQHLTAVRESSGEWERLEGHVQVMVVHQPRGEIFELLDDLLVGIHR